MNPNSFCFNPLYLERVMIFQLYKIFFFAAQKSNSDETSDLCRISFDLESPK